MPGNKARGGIYAPPYYSRFRCIADSCRHSCCIDWEICIDDDTYVRYRHMSDILPTVEPSEEGASFALCPDGRCPHLDERGLCRIILTHGEDALCDICREHPRFYNYINSRRTEVGLGMVCEEACRLMLGCTASFELSLIEETDGTDEDARDFDPIPMRDDIISFIETEGSYIAKITRLKKKYCISDPYTPEEWIDLLLDLEILDSAWALDISAMRGRLLLSPGVLTDKCSSYYLRLLNYFVYRHVSISVCIDDLRARLGFAIFSTEVVRSLFENRAGSGTFCCDAVPEELIDAARRYSAEIEYSEDNTAELIFAFDSALDT